jgi:hypothetical protein
MKNYIIHRNTIAKILSDKNLNIGSSGANGRIKGMDTFVGDISLQEWNDGKDNIFVEINSRKGNLNKAVNIIKKSGFKIKKWNHPSGLITRTIVYK